jgi:hypothetical protein
LGVKAEEVGEVGSEVQGVPEVEVTILTGSEVVFGEVGPRRNSVRSVSRLRLIVKEKRKLESP